MTSRQHLNNNKYDFIVLLILLALLWATCNLTACYSPKKADKQVSKALAYYPEKVAKIARNAFPCTNTQNDTIIVSKDTVIEVPCPDDYHDVQNIVHDTVQTKVYQNKIVKVPVTLPIKTVTITKLVEDSAKIYMLSQAYDEVSAKKDEEKLRADKAEDKASRRGKWNLLLFILLAASIALNYIQFKKK